VVQEAISYCEKLGGMLGAPEAVCTAGDYGLELFHNEDMDNCLRAEDPKKACMDLHAQWLEKIKEAAGREW